mmetsp:Transcript_35126/g.83487  ORF Transcript_35126/g.83487 Transcript_35126/m.83487 type:complete len:88 (+) Transcript_35126:176-439(+)
MCRSSPTYRELRENGRESPTEYPPTILTSGRCGPVPGTPPPPPPHTPRSLRILSRLLLLPPPAKHPYALYKASKAASVLYKASKTFQ